MRMANIITLAHNKNIRFEYKMLEQIYSTGNKLVIIDNVSYQNWIISNKINFDSKPSLEIFNFKTKILADPSKF